MKRLRTLASVLTGLAVLLALAGPSEATWVKVYNSQEDEDVQGSTTDDQTPWGEIGGQGITSWYFIAAPPDARIDRLSVYVADAVGVPDWPGWNWHYRIKIGRTAVSAISTTPDSQVSGGYTTVHDSWDPAEDLTAWPLWRDIDLQTPYTMSSAEKYIIKFQYVSGGDGDPNDDNYWLSTGDYITHDAYADNSGGTVSTSRYLPRLELWANRANLSVYTLYVSPSTLWSHELVHVTVDIWNRSDVDVTTPFDVALKYRSVGDAFWMDAADPAEVTGVNAMRHATASWHWGPPSTGCYEFEVEADVNHEIDETAEDDNFLSYLPGSYSYRVYGESDTPIKTLILTDSWRWSDVGYFPSEVSAVMADLDYLAQNDPRGPGVVVNIADFESTTDLIQRRNDWVANFGTLTTKLNTNAYVAQIDKLIENLHEYSYPSLKYVIIAGSHEVVPMYVRTDEWPGDDTEYTWAGTNYDPNTDMYHLYRTSSPGNYLTDATYADLAYRDYGWHPELTRELAVGRLVETPGQIGGIIDNYLALPNAVNPMEDLACIGSVDFTDGARKANENLSDCGFTADTTLIANGFDSTLVPPKMEAKDDLVYIGGHGNYNLMKTRASPYDAFMAGDHATFGDTWAIDMLPTAVVIAAGCHNGALLPNKTYHAPDLGGTSYHDFPEEFADIGAIAYLGSTGFTWITTGDLANDASTGFSEELCATTVRKYAGGVTIGEAYRRAANAYYNLHKNALRVADKKVLGIHQLYGMPGYEATAGTCGGQGYSFGDTMWTQNGDIVMVETTLTVDSWTLDPSGVVVIPGADYTGGPDTPVLPVLLYTEPGPVPPGTCVKSAFFLFAAPPSQSTDLMNVVPTTGVGNASTSIPPQTFYYPDFYPPVQCSGYVTPNVGGVDAEVGMVIHPVQYNPMTGATRVWEQMLLVIEYDMTQIPFCDNFSGGDLGKWQTTELGAASVEVDHLDGVSPPYSLKIVGASAQGDRVKVESYPIAIDFAKPYRIQCMFKYSSFHWDRFLIFGHVRLLLDYPYMALKYDPVGDNSFVGNSIGPAFNSYAAADNWVPISVTVDPQVREYTIQINDVLVGTVSYQATVEPSATIWFEDNGSVDNFLNASYDDFLVMGSHVPVLASDFDHDGDADLDDFANHFVACMTGPGVQTTLDCQACDLDGDEDVDVDDFAMFAADFGGP